MPCPQLILLGCFARTHQISKRLGAFVRNGDQDVVAATL